MWKLTFINEHDFTNHVKSTIQNCLSGGFQGRVGVKISKTIQTNRYIKQEGGNDSKAICKMGGGQGATVA